MQLTKATGLIITALVSTVLVAAPPATAQTARTTAQDVEIAEIVPNGSGCPAGTANASVLGGNQFQVTYDSFAVGMPEGSSTGLTEKFCQLRLTLNVPAGKQIAINDATYRGYLSLGTRTVARLRTLFYFTQSAGSVVEDPMEVRTLASSPGEKDWKVTSTPEAKAWSRCGGTFFFNAKGRLTLNSTGQHTSSYLTMDTTNSTVYTYNMRSC
jgi:hypothetical protein